MHPTPTKETDTIVVINIERSENTVKVGPPALKGDENIGERGLCTMDGVVKVEKSLLDDLGSGKTVGELSLESGKKNNKRENGKSRSGKKPPRPPRGLSLELDAADQKLMKEIREVAMMKRARIERLKALKRMKEEKASSGSTSLSSSGNLIAIVFTILFCVVIILQGWHSSGSSTTVGSSRKLNGGGGRMYYSIAVEESVGRSSVPLTRVKCPPKEKELE